jgi:hypothetical protein
VSRSAAALVCTAEHRGRASKFLVGHGKRKLRVAFLERLAVGQCVPILIEPPEDHVVLLSRGDSVAPRHVLRGIDHRVARERIVVEVVDDPVFVAARASARARRGIVDVWSIGGAIRCDNERAIGTTGSDFTGASKDGPQPCRTSLIDRRATDMSGPDPTHKPGQSIEGSLLRDRQTKYAEIENVRIDLTKRERSFRGCGRKLDAVKVRQRALRFGKGGWTNRPHRESQCSVVKSSVPFLINAGLS